MDPTIMATAKVELPVPAQLERRVENPRRMIDSRAMIRLIIQHCNDRGDAIIRLPSGTPILNVPKYTESASVTYTRPLSAQMRLVSRLSNSYVGPATDIAYTYETLSPYNLVAARIGLATDKWSAFLFGDNLANKHAELSVDHCVRIVVGSGMGLKSRSGVGVRRICRDGFDQRVHRPVGLVLRDADVRGLPQRPLEWRPLSRRLAPRLRQRPPEPRRR